VYGLYALHTWCGGLRNGIAGPLSMVLEIAPFLLLSGSDATTTALLRLGAAAHAEMPRFHEGADTEFGRTKT
jgi:hypothetical protein